MTSIFKTQHDNKFFLKFNFQFILLIFLLLALALTNLYSITHSGGSRISSLFWNQILWILLGFALFVMLSQMNYKFFVRLAYWFYALNLLALVLLFFFGQSLSSANRWFDLGWFSYQPSETMKITLACALAHFFSKKPTHYVYHFKSILPAVLLTLTPMVLIMYQPDLGTALLLGIQTCTMAFFTKINKKLLISFSALILIITPVLWSFVLKDYQKSRVLMFISSQQDPQGAGYHTIQSKIAVGSGKLFGKGFKQGTQAQLEFLPERHTDFVFSVLSEEHGFIGSLLVIGLFLLLFLKILKIASMSRDKSGFYLCVGVLSIVFWQVFVNTAMAIGLLPVVGVPLPLFSYGGSNMITTFIALGLVSSVYARRYMYS